MTETWVVSHGLEITSGLGFGICREDEVEPHDSQEDNHRRRIRPPQRHRV